MACSNCSKKQIRNLNMQTTQINQQTKNPYVEKVRSIAIRSNKKCQACNYKLNISDTFQQHGIVNGAIDEKGAIKNVFDTFINMLVVEFQLNQNEKDYLIQQSVNFNKINDAVWSISKIMDNRPPNMQNTQPQQIVKQQNVVHQRPENQVVHKAKTPYVVQTIHHPHQKDQNTNMVAKPVVNNHISSSANMSLQEKTNALFERIKKQNEEMLKKNLT